jgi:bacteriocin-like protein
MKSLNLLAVEVLSIEELASVKGGYNIPTPIIIEELTSKGGYNIPTPIIIEE